MSESQRKKKISNGSYPGRFDSLPKRILAARLAAGITSEEAAKACGTTRQSISMWENGETKSPHLSKLHKFAAITKVRVGWLLNREPPDPDLPEVAPRQKQRLIIDETIQVIPEVPSNLENLQTDFKNATRRAGAPQWALPTIVVQHTLRGHRDQFVVVRSTFDLNTISADDYLIVDIACKAIDRTGVYFLRVPKKGIRHVEATKKNGSLKVTCPAGLKYKPSQHPVVGRVAAVLRAV